MVDVMDRQGAPAATRKLDDDRWRIDPPFRAAFIDNHRLGETGLGDWLVQLAPPGVDQPCRNVVPPRHLRHARPRRKVSAKISSRSSSLQRRRRSGPEKTVI